MVSYKYLINEPYYTNNKNTLNPLSVSPDSRSAPSHPKHPSAPKSPQEYHSNSPSKQQQRPTKAAWAYPHHYSYHTH
jgi:hypothetical protein